MSNSLFSYLLAATIVAQSTVIEIPVSSDEATLPATFAVVNGASTESLPADNVKPGKSKKYKKKMSKQMKKKRKRH